MIYTLTALCISVMSDLEKCNCSDVNCKRKIISTIEGRLYVVNHFTCGKIKDFILKYKNHKL